MFKRKQDVDKHVLSVLNRKRDEKERNAQGYQIARLYLDIKEYETAKRYLASFLQVRENYPQAHQMMGDINEALDKKELAIESYKKALDLGGFGSANRQLVLKICELYCDLGADDQRMKYWLQKCEELYPQSDVVYRMKSQLVSSSSNGKGDDVEMENLILTELQNRPTDLDLRIKLLQLYLDMKRVDEAYDAAVDTDLTTAFVDSLPWYECVMVVFEAYSQHNQDSERDIDFMLMNMHILRNAAYLSLSNKAIQPVVQIMKKFDKAVRHADGADYQEEWWVALLKEMKGQLLFLAGLVLIKRAMMGSIPWQEVNQLSGACFLASRGIPPLDGQAIWYVNPRSKEYVKFYHWLYLQSYDRLSQVGHMIQQLSQGDITDWSRTVYQQTMTGSGHMRVFEGLYGGDDVARQELSNNSFIYSTSLMVGQVQEPLTRKQLFDIDRVAYQTHLGKLSHLVWLCLQRYSPDMDCQPNYHFSLMENIQFSVKNIETAGSESLCQLDILTFLFATVRSAGSSISENVFSYEDQSGRPTLLPVCLGRPLCTPEQQEWWSAAFKFCSNSVKDNFSRLRRVLIRGVEVVRLRGSHGVSIPMMGHLARCLDAKVKSFRESEFGCRCSAAELSAMEARALFYWERAYSTLQKVKKNQHPAMVKNRLFAEEGDGDLPPRLVDKLLSEADFAIAESLKRKGQLEEALERFERHSSPWASFRSAQIYRSQANKCYERNESYKALIRKSRDLLYKTLDRLNGDKRHELNFLVSKELDDSEVEIQGFDWEEDETSNARDSFLTPTKSSTSNGTAGHQGEDNSFLTHSTPRLAASNGVSQLEMSDVGVTPSASRSQISHASPQSQQPRPSPERLDSQIKSLGYSQTTLFKTVLDRNEELVLMHSKLMEEHRNNNNQLQTALQDNKKVMEDLKVMMVENRDTLKGIKTELASLKSTVLAAPPPLAPPSAIPQGPPLLVATPHMAPAPRGAYPGFPQPQPAPGVHTYPGYLLNSPIPPQPHASATAGANFRNPGMAAGRSSQMSKFKMPDEEEEEEEELDHTVEDLSVMYPEYFTDQDYSQYYTPDSHIQDWSLRSAGMEPPPLPLPVSPAIQQPPPVSRMAMPQPGFFASALRGQSLQYAQQSTPAAPSTKLGGVIGPGFFSSSVATMANPSSLSAPTFSLAAHAENTNTLTPSAQGNIPIFSAMSNDNNTTSPAVNAGGFRGSTQPFGGTASDDLGANLGLKVVFHIKALFPARNAKGGVTILMGPSDIAIVVMMSDSEEMLFQHNVHGLMLHPASPTLPGVTWTAAKVGTPSPSRETVTVVTVPESMGNLLRSSLQKTASAVTPESGGNSAMTAPASVPAPGGGQGGFFGNLNSSVPGTGASANPDAGKTLFGGFSFSSTPVVTPAHTDREKAIPHKGATSPVKMTDDATKPFAGVSLSVPKFTSAASATGGSPGQGMVTQAQTSPSKGLGGRDDERLEEYEPNVDFKPLIPLPELVEKKTGEENETALFVDRCRLFRYDPETKQWKERGIGEMKILCDNVHHRYRVVMRRDQILKLCANHFISSSMTLSPLASSDKTWCYSAMDYSEEEMKMEQLAVKFKNQEKAKRFKDAFEDCVEKLKKSDDSGAQAQPDSKSPGKTVKEAADSTTSSAPASKPSISFAVATTKATSAASLPPPQSSSTVSSSKGSISELFKPKAGSWECDACLVRNEAQVEKCVACSKAKPGSKSADTSGGGLFKPFGTQSTGGFSFGSSPSSSGSIFGKTTTTAAATASASSAATTTTSAKPATTSTAASSGKPVPLSELFKPKAGTWECDGCLCQNQADLVRCPACKQLRPGAEPEKQETSSVPSTGSFTFGSAGGFSFGSQPSSQTPSNSGFSFGAPAAASNTAAPSNVPKTGGFSFPGAGSSNTSTPSAPATGGFKLPGGFSFGSATTTTAAATTTTPKPSTAVSAPSSSSTAGPSGSLLASLLTSDESKSEPTDKSVGFNFTMTPSQKSSAIQPVADTTSSSGFQFSFQKSPADAVSTPSSKSTTQVPKSPEVDEHGLYVTKEGEDSHIHFEPIVQLPDKVETKTGEEDEDVLFESRARMYRFLAAEWREKGIGVMKILQHKQTKSSRVLMRRDQVFKICCNHIITPELNLQPMPKMEGKAWLWFAMDFSEENGAMEQLAIRFKKPETATEFKDIFDRCKDSAKTSTTPKKDASESKAPVTNDSDDDVIFVKEEKSPGFIPKVDTSASPKKTEDDEADVVFVKEEEATPEQKALAAKYKLPANFYLYEKRKPCKGCLGCTDGEGLPSFAVTTSKTKTPTKDKEPANQPRSYADAAKSPITPASFSPSTTANQTAPPGKSIFGTPTETPTAGSIGKSIFGASATLDQSSSLFGSNTSPKPSIFGASATTPTDFSSLSKGDNKSTPSGDSPFANFTFGAGSSTPDFSSLAAASGGQTSFLKKADTNSPFKFHGAGQQLFGRSSGGDGDGEGDVAASNDVHFEPIIPLPELVEVKTGDEDWTTLFSHRAKLYKFERSLKQWKERGVGDIKIMSFNQEMMFRVLQRREQVLKISCNHLITEDMDLKPMSNSESSWCWVATDLSEEGPSVEQFAVKFKNKELAASFKDMFEDCQEKLKNKKAQPEPVTSTTEDIPQSNESLEERRYRETHEQQAHQVVEEEDDDEDYEDEDDDEEDDDEIIFEKRATLSCHTGEKWKKLGIGQLCVKYNDDLNGHSVNFSTDDGNRLCSHIICREHDIKLDGKNKSCEWKPIDYSTDEPIRRHFGAGFSSLPAAEEFAKVFMEGKKLALDSELSENLPTDIDVPEVFSHGEAAKRQ